MTEYTETFEVVLYFNRKVFIKPKEPVFNDIQKSNPKLDTDNILDIYSDLNKKYKNDLEKYEMLENKDLIVTGCVLIPEDNKFIKNYQAIEKDVFFVEWDEKSKKLIKDTIRNLIDKCKDIIIDQIKSNE